MNNPGLKLSDLLNYLPQKAPFRFVDEILEVNDQRIAGTYTFKPDEFFYAGHFPGNPVTPGVILLESMCQVGVVAFGIYFLSKEVSLNTLDQWLALFTDAEVEFFSSVSPGEKVMITGEKVFFRRMKLRVKIEMRDSSGKLLATATAAGHISRKKN
jgi:3-hydroxyacyl-[acyl-carrier-protein] dehydratase